MLVSKLQQETEPDARYEIYGHIFLECQLAECTSAAVRFALARYQEFRDVTSMIAYSNALAGNGDLAAGLVRAKEALEIAIGCQTLINYAAGNLVRETIKTRSIDKVNEAISTLIDSTQLPRQGDCALEADWVDAAEELGADRELTSWVRSAAVAK